MSSLFKNYIKLKGLTTESTTPHLLSNESNVYREVLINNKSNSSYAANACCNNGGCTCPASCRVEEELEELKDTPQYTP